MEQQSVDAYFNRPVKILIADDHPIVRKMVMATLKEERHFDVIGVAENGLQAVQKAEALNPDVVVLNVTMPVLDGFETARRIRKILPEIAIVILFSQADKHLIEAAKKIGARAFVPKTQAAVIFRSRSSSSLGRCL